MSVIVSYRRTPYGRFLGALANLSAVELGAHALTHALKDAAVQPDEVDYVIVGQVLQAGLGQNPARQTAVAAGVPLSTPAVTLNAVCLSGAEAITQAHRLITSGEASIVACVGQESMSKAPHLISRSRSGTKYGPITVLDSIEVDGLTDAFASTSMGLATEEGNTKRGISRADQDDWPKVPTREPPHTVTHWPGKSQQSPFQQEGPPSPLIPMKGSVLTRPLSLWAR